MNKPFVNFFTAHMEAAAKRSREKWLKQLCNIEITEGHDVPCFDEDGRALAFLPKGVIVVATYLFETLCGSFTCIKVDDKVLYVDADKSRMSPA